MKSRTRKFFSLIESLNQRLRVRRILAERGWNQSSAAQHLGIAREHLNRILNGQRDSARILRAIESLPAKP